MKRLPSGVTDEQLLHLRSLVNKFHSMQEARKAFENKIRAIKDETTPMGRLGFILEEGVVEGASRKVVDVKHIETITQRGKTKKVLGVNWFEKELEKKMKPIVESHRFWAEFASGVKGIGILSAAKIIAYFEPYWAELEIVTRRKKKHKGVELDEEQVVTKKLYPPRSRSSLTHLCDYLVSEKTGRAERRTRGQATSGNPKYKTMFYVLFDALLRQKGKCYDLWSEYHEQVKASYPEWLQKWYGAKTRKEAKKLHPKTYIPNTLDLSRRRFIKTFISILWEEFQEIYNMPITTPQHAPNVPLTEEEWVHPKDLIE